jgi:nitrous oxide reductase accessory protein NosL
MAEMTRFYYFLLVGLCALVLSACTNDPGAGPIEVEWEYDTCQRCNMALADGFHAAQVRHSPTGKPTKVYLFDDIGCALIWLEDQSWRDEPGTEIWVNDYQTGGWIDARKAHYVGGQKTPMLYGLGAQLEQTPGSVTFDRAKRHVFEVEKRLNLHGAR